MDLDALSCREHVEGPVVLRLLPQTGRSLRKGQQEYECQSCPQGCAQRIVKQKHLKRHVDRHHKQEISEWLAASRRVRPRPSACLWRCPTIPAVKLIAIMTHSFLRVRLVCKAVRALLYAASLPMALHAGKQFDHAAS